MRTGDVIAFVRTMEQAIVAALAAAGVEAHTRTPEGPDYTGVWVGDEKIASIGVHLSRGVTTHGFAVNVTNDLQPFGWVVPCGLPEVQMTSVVEETGGDASAARVAGFAAAMAQAFAAEHGMTPVDTPAEAVWGGAPVA
jgi:lipoyl(octanoyl) transferase